MRMHLLTAVRTMIRADSDPVRQALFARMRDTSPTVRLVWRIHRSLGRTRLSSLLVSVYGIKSWLTIAPDTDGRADLLSIAVHANAKRQVQLVADVYGRDRVNALGTGLSRLLRPSGLRRAAGLLFPSRATRRIFRFVHRVNQRHDFLVACRIASLMGCYGRTKSVLVERRPLGVLVSSDSNPEEVGLVSAARSLSLGSIFISHAYTTSVSPPLNFDLSILEGEAALAAHMKKGPVRGSVFLMGVEGPSRPMDPLRLSRQQPTIGVFPPKVIVWPVFRRLILDCQQRFDAREIVIRWHPSMLDRRPLREVVDNPTNISETPSVASLHSVAERCDWVVADAGSNVHMPVLKLGIPTIALKDISVFLDAQADLYGFVSHRVIFPPVTALADLETNEAVSFYSGDWIQRFKRFDAGYLRAEEVRAADLRSALTHAIAEFRNLRPEARA